MLTPRLAEIQHAIRSLARAKVFALVAVLSLALGIGGTTAMIAVMDAIYVRPLPYANAERVAVLNEVPPPDSATIHYGTSLATFADWRMQAHSYESMAALRMVPLQMREEDTGRIDNGAQVTASFFSVLGIAPRLGRVFTEEEARTAAPVVVLSHDVWATDFGADPRIIGMTWRGRLLSGGSNGAEGHTIIGVMPRGVAFPWTSKVWVPLDASAATARDRRGLIVLGLLRSDVSAAAADLEIRSITGSLEASYPETMRGRSAQATPLREWMVGYTPNAAQPGQRARNARIVLLGFSAFVLLIAAANVASLFLVRSLARRGEMLVRAALGASTVRIVWLTLIESLLVSLAGGALGVLAATLALEIVSARLGLDALGVVAQVDARVIAVAFGMAILTALVVGMVPAAKLSRELYGGLRLRAAAGASGTRAGITQSALVASQIAAALMLVTGAGLLGRDFVDLMRRAPGYDPENLAAITLPPTLHPGEIPAVVPYAVERVRALPEITAAVEQATDLDIGVIRTEAGRDLAGGNVQVTAVGAEFFRILGIPLASGREFAGEDRPGSSAVAIVNQTAARLLSPADPAVGQRLFLADSESGGAGGWVEVVGVVADSRVLQDPRSAVNATIYRPFAQGGATSRGWLTIFARSSSDPTPYLAVFDRIIAELHTGPGWQGWGPRVVTGEISEYLAMQRFNAAVLAGFSSFALMLAAMGVFGVVAGVAARRRSEIAIRLALGATASSIVGLISRQGAAIAAIGAIAGIAASFALARVLDSVLTMTSATDPLVLGSSAAFLGVVVMLAALVPVLHALRVSPAAALRNE